MSVGIKDVAKKAGVSISTVSNVLNGSKYVSPELVERVRSVVEDLSYEANPIARSMKSNKSGTIGVITEDLCGVFYPYVVKGIDSVARKKGYRIMIYDLKGAVGKKDIIKQEKEIFQSLIASRVDGIIFVSAVPDIIKEKYFSQILKMANQYKNIPLISLERNFADVGISSVYFDGYENACIAVQHLVDCGCRKICHITGPMEMQTAVERIRGYQDCMKKNQLLITQEMIAYGDYGHQSGYIAMKKLLHANPELDGVFCGNDQMAIGALKILKEYKKRVPQDIKLIGYDDVFVSSVVEPSLSTIHIRKWHAGAEAARLLFHRIEKNIEEDAIGIKMQSRLVVRKSTVETASEDWFSYDW